MGKRKPVSLLKRSNANNPSDDSKKKKQKIKSGNASGSAPKHSQPPKQRTLAPSGDIHKQATYAVGRLLHADATGRDGASLKSLTLAPHISNKKAVYAVTIETLKYVPVLQQLVDRANVLSTGLSRPAAYVLIRDLLWGSEGLQPSGPAERAILDLKSPLQDALDAILSEAGTEDVNDLLPAVKLAAAAANRPRTARVNELKMSVDEALAWFQSPPPEHAKKWSRLHSKISIDPHLPELLVFPPGTDLHDHPLVATGALILQSKASCMPARALEPQQNWKVIDACAAPGNKTTHLAAIIKSNKGGSVIAFDKDPTRLKRLRDNADRAGAISIIDARRADFLAIDTADSEFADVAAVLLDPSCSGSGTVFSRMDHLLPSAVEKASGKDAVGYKDDRVTALANFQCTALRHALSFPAVQRVVYSTCSLHAAENEQVVASVLDGAQEKGFQLISALPTWPRRGERGWGLSDDDAEKLVRTDPLEDGTDGFFVALFERKKKEKKKV